MRYLAATPRAATPQLAALVVTEANPRRDPNHHYMPILARLIADALNTHAD